MRWRWRARRWRRGSTPSPSPTLAESRRGRSESAAMSSPPAAGARSHHRDRFRGRNPDERHRGSTPLELLYDLTIVVGFATAADELAHAIAGNHVWAGVGG